MCSLIEGQNIKYSEQIIITEPELTNLDFSIVSKNGKLVKSLNYRPQQPVVIPNLNTLKPKFYYMEFGN